MKNVKVSERLISEFLNKKGLELYDFACIMDDIDDFEILGDLADQDFNPGFNLYFSRNQKDDVLALNVKTYIGYKEPYSAFPDFIKERIPDIEDKIEKNIENIYEFGTEYQDNFRIWKEESPKSWDFNVVGKSDGYWGISKINSWDAFEPVNNKDILKGLKKHLINKESNCSYESKEEMFEAFEESINDLFQISYYERDGYLDYVKNELGLIQYSDSLKKTLQDLYTSANTFVDYYEKKVNIVKEYLELKVENEFLEPSILKQYDNYVFRKNLETLGVELDQKSRFEIKTKEGALKFDLDSTLDFSNSKFAKIDLLVDGKPYDKEMHGLIKLNGKTLKDYNIFEQNNDNGFFKREQMYKDIKELKDFNELYQLVGQKRSYKMFEIVGVLKPENIKKEIVLNDVISFNKNENCVELKVSLNSNNLIEQSKTSFGKKDGKFDITSLVTEITKLSLSRSPQKDNEVTRSGFIQVQVEPLKQVQPVTRLQKISELKASEYKYNTIQKNIDSNFKFSPFILTKEIEKIITPVKPKNKEHELGH